MEENNHQQLLESIKCGEVKMKPRWHFILKAALMMVGALIVMFSIIYLISFIIFMERQTGAGFITAFGPRGWARFLVTLPWVLIAGSLLFMVVLELLVRRYSFAYRRPLMYSACGIIICAVAGGIIVAGSGFHERLSSVGLYRSAMMDRDDIHPGMISAFSGSDFIITDRRGRMFKILVASDTMPVGGGFMMGDRVIVFGDGEGTSSVRAFGIRKLKNEIQR